MRDDELGRLLGEPAETRHSLRADQVEVDADVDAAVAEVAVQGAAQAVFGEQRPEVAEVRAEPGGRHRAVLPAGPGLTAVGRPGRGAGGVLADPPQGPLPGRVRDDRAVHGVGGPQDAFGVRSRLGRGVAAGLDEQPGGPARQPGRLPYEVGGHALDGERAVRKEARGGVGGGGLVGVSEDGQGAGARGLDQAHGGLGDDAEGALAAAEGPDRVGAAGVFGEQGVERVPGDAAREVGVAGAEEGEVGGDQFGDAFGAVGRRPARTPGAFGARPAPLLQTQRLAAVADHRQRPHVVRRGAPGHRVRAAGVVADHSAEGAAAVGGGVGAEGQAVGCGGGPQVVQDHSGLDDGGAGGGVQVEDRAQMAGQIEDEAGAGGLSGDGRAAAARHHRHPVLPAHGQGGGDVLGVARGEHAERDTAVVGGVHGRQRPCGGAEVARAAYGGAERGDEIRGSGRGSRGGGGGRSGTRSMLFGHSFSMPSAQVNSWDPRGRKWVSRTKKPTRSSQTDRQVSYSDQDLRRNYQLQLCMIARTRTELS